MTPIYSRGNVSQKCKESEKMAGATTAACGLVQPTFAADRLQRGSFKMVSTQNAVQQTLITHRGGG
jgi:hypothetical protein